MNFKKLVSLTVVCTILAGTASLAGCGKKVNDKDDKGRTVISVGSYPSKEGVARDNFNARKEKFEKDNPDVVINPDEWKFEIQSFYAKAAGGQLPTVFETYLTEINQCIDSGYAADISKVLKKRGYDGKFNKRLIELVSNGGKVFAFPYGVGLQGLGYNTEMFEKAGLMESDGTPKQPKDWDEVREFAIKIKNATGKPGIVFPTSGNSGGWLFTCLAWSYGTEFMKQNKDGKWEATFDSKEAANALQYIKDLKWKYDVLPANTLIDYNEYYKVFATGGAGIMMTDSALPRNVVQYGMTPDKVGMMAMPAGPKKHVSLIAGNVFMISENSTEDQIDAAIRWLETAYNYKATDDFKKNKENNINLQLEKNQLVGIKPMSVWDSDTESVKFEHNLIESKANANINHVRLYNEFIENGKAEMRPEEPVCAQELYATLDSCIQEVLTNKDADCAKVLKKACADFQKNYLDNITY